MCQNGFADHFFVRLMLAPLAVDLQSLLLGIESSEMESPQSPFLAGFLEALMKEKRVIDALSTFALPIIIIVDLICFFRTTRRLPPPRL